jgi:hypothetical protein
MNIEFTSHAWEEFQYWLENDAEVVRKIKELLKVIRQSPFQGTGWFIKYKAKRARIKNALLLNAGSIMTINSTPGKRLDLTGCRPLQFHLHILDPVHQFFCPELLLHTVHHDGERLRRGTDWWQDFQDA